MPSNTAAWLNGAKIPLEVKTAPYTSPGPDEIVIQNAAIAINPIDHIKQDLGKMVYGWIKYPFIIGTDVAGEVVEVGSRVTRFKIGDRVLSLATGTVKEYNTSAKGAFQKYTVALEHMTSSIPNTTSYESAAVLPLGISTAACGLFQEDQLALQHPSPSGSPKPTGKTLLIWGGSTSVGSNAIQLAVASGYEVITTASPKNFDYVNKLGASRVFDYNSETVISDIIQALRNKSVAGAMSIGQGAAEACLDILHECKGEKFISMASYPTPPKPYNWFKIPRTILYFGSWFLTHWCTTWSRDIRTKFIVGSSLIDNGIGKMIYEDFLPRALAEGSYTAVPEPHVVGKGLENVQIGFAMLKEGVSAKKLVITL